MPKKVITIFFLFAQISKFHTGLTFCNLCVFKGSVSLMPGFITLSAFEHIIFNHAMEPA